MDERCDNCGSDNVVTLHDENGTTDVCLDCGYESDN